MQERLHRLLLRIVAIIALIVPLSVKHDVDQVWANFGEIGGAWMLSGLESYSCCSPYLSPLPHHPWPQRNFLLLLPIQNHNTPLQESNLFTELHLLSTSTHTGKLSCTLGSFLSPHSSVQSSEAHIFYPTRLPSWLRRFDISPTTQLPLLPTKS